MGGDYSSGLMFRTAKAGGQKLAVRVENELIEKAFPNKKIFVATLRPNERGKPDAENPQVAVMFQRLAHLAGQPL